MYLLIISRAENHPTTGRAQYRVKNCTRKWFDGFFSKKNIPVISIPKGLIIETNKPYRVGNLINPRKALGI